MPPDAVVKTNNVVGNIVGSLHLIGIILLPNPLHLQIKKEMFHNRVVPAISFAAHAADQAMSGAAFDARYLHIACPCLNAQLIQGLDFFER